MSAPTPIPSPCISVCLIDERSGWCRGCLRTIDEIASWAALDDAGRRAVWCQLGPRRIALFGPQAAVPLPEWAK